MGLRPIFKLLIGPSLRDGPDTLNPIGISIIHLGPQAQIHVEPGPLRGPYTKNEFRCAVPGGAGPPGLPPGPPFTLDCLSI